MTPAAAGHRRQLAFGLACAVHLYGLYWPRPATGPGATLPYADKVAHVVLFGLVAYLAVRVGVPARWVIGVLIAEAVASEFIQHYLLPRRSGDPLDSLADVAGVALGVWLALRPARPLAPDGPSRRGTDTP